MKPFQGLHEKESATPYEDLAERPSEAELLHYINFKLGHTNALLTAIKSLLTMLVGGLAGLLGFLLYRGVL